MNSFISEANRTDLSIDITHQHMRIDLTLGFIRVDDVMHDLIVRVRKLNVNYVFNQDDIRISLDIFGDQPVIKSLA